MIAWQDIDTVLLDLDGTLLDLYFDNFFWTEYLPQRLAVEKQQEETAVKRQLLLHMREIQGSLDWYCLDYWSTLLELDVAALKAEIAHMVKIHPGVVEFLDALRVTGKKIILVTNGHRKGLDLKLGQTGLSSHFDYLVSSHDYQVEKEQLGFWEALHAQYPFDPARTVLVDDNMQVLASAQAFGIAYLVAPVQPDSKQPRKEVGDFLALRGFHEIMPTA